MNTSNISVTIPKGSFSGGISAFGIASALFSAKKESILVTSEISDYTIPSEEPS